MNIGFDIDGVLTDLEAFQTEYGKRFLGREAVNPKGVSIREMYECTEKEEYLFWRKYLLYYSYKYPIREGAKESLRKIAEENNKLFIITSRIKSDEKGAIGTLMRALVKRFLKGIPYEKIVFCSVANSAKEKCEACKQHGIDIMVEDTPENILSLRNVTTILCFDAAYNRELPQNIVRVSSFDEIYHFIHKRNGAVDFYYLDREERRSLNSQEKRNYYETLQKYYRGQIRKEGPLLCERFYMSLYSVARFCFRIKYPYQIVHEEQVPHNGGAIYVANHRDMLDPPLMMGVVGKKPVHLVLKAEFKKHPLGFLLSAMGCFYVKRDNRDSQVLVKDEMIKAVLSGANVILFPEGTRNKTEQQLLPFHRGAVCVARTTGRPIIPVGISKRGASKILLNVGEPVKVGYDDDLVEANLGLQEKISALLAENEKILNEEIASDSVPDYL